MATSGESAKEQRQRRKLVSKLLAEKPRTIVELAAATRLSRSTVASELKRVAHAMAKLPTSGRRGNLLFALGKKKEPVVLAELPVLSEEEVLALTYSAPMMCGAMFSDFWIGEKRDALAAVVALRGKTNGRVIKRD